VRRWTGNSIRTVIAVVLRSSLMPGVPRGASRRPRTYPSVWASMDSTGGRSRTIAVHESPASADA